ncbi:hypothetical protein MSPP1_003484 [Malassezia sp. CBS 17886]|nr:hypothetical protein MSPP1_003484 [Malassezia sp. CBS 17886]
MPKELPKVDLEHPSDLDFITQSVLTYASGLAKERLRARGQRGAAPALEDTVELALERWVYAARARLVPNVHVNGMALHDYAKHAAAVEPFDEVVAERVATLSDEIDDATERVVACRKRVPTAYASAVRERAQALGALADAREDARQRRLRTSKARTRFNVIARGKPLLVDADAKARTEATLDAVYTELESLGEAATDQERLVRRLRSLPR